MTNNSVELPSVEKQPRERRSTHIANHLKEMIFSGKLKAGDRLPTEEQLCKHFGVSRTTLRESVQMLRVFGLLDVTPGCGSFIRLPDPAALMKDLALLGYYSSMNENDIVQVRELLQVEMVKNACDSSNGDKKILHSKVINRQGTPEEIEAMEKDWNISIANLAGNKLAAIMLESIFSMLRNQRVKMFSDPDEIMRSMGVQIRINSAIMEGDKTMAMRIMASYLGNTVSSTNNINAA